MKRTEADTIFHQIDPELTSKGYTNYIGKERTMDSGRIDVEVYDNTLTAVPVTGIECKKAGTAADNSSVVEQALRYGRDKEWPIVWTTNGNEWRAWYVPTGTAFLVDGQPVTELPEHSVLLKWIKEQENGEYMTTQLPKKTEKQLEEVVDYINNLLQNRQHINKNQRARPINALIAIILLEKQGRLQHLITSGYFAEVLTSDVHFGASWFRDTLYPKLEREFPFIFSTEKTTMSTVKTLHDDVLMESLRQLYSVDFDDVDHIGQVYEYFLNAVSIKNDQGQYFTPRKIVQFMTDMQPYSLGKESRIVDPFCGTAGFLTHAYKDLESRIGTDGDMLLRLKENTFYGQDAEADTAVLALTNMFIAGTESNNISVGNSLSTHTGALENGKASDVTTNIPFVGDPTRGSGAAGRAAQLTDSALAPYRIHTSNVEVLALQKCILLLNDGGYGRVIIPASMLSKKTKDYVELRRWLIANVRLDVVVELPQYSFSHTPAAAAILFFQKTKVKKQKTLFARPLSIGYSLDRDQVPNNSSDLDRILISWKDVQKGYSPSVGEVAEYVWTELGDYCRLDVSNLIKHDTEEQMTLRKLVESNIISFNPKGGEKINGPLLEIKNRHLRMLPIENREFRIVDFFEKANKSKQDKPKMTSTANKVLQRNDILFAHSGDGSIGAVAMIPDRPQQLCVAAQLLWTIRVIDPTKISPYYLYKVLGTHFKEKEGMAKQMKTARVTEKWDSDAFLDVPFLLPSIDEQMEETNGLKRGIQAISAGANMVNETL